MMVIHILHERCEQERLLMIVIHDIWLQMHSLKHDIHGVAGIQEQMEMELLMLVEMKYITGRL